METHRPLAAAWRSKHRPGSLAEFKARLDEVLEDRDLTLAYTRNPRTYLRAKSPGTNWPQTEQTTLEYQIHGYQRHLSPNEGMSQAPWSDGSRST